MFNQCCHHAHGSLLKQLHCIHTVEIFTKFRYIENQTLQKTGNSPEAEESVDEVEASSLYPAMVDMLYWKWRFFKIAFFPLYKVSVCSQCFKFYEYGDLAIVRNYRVSHRMA
ncbi:hypothetical protein T08_2772 [Trichinella sp. T8]|nr:hypothetical protein T08_2772 [Trichinella sp. T8]